MLPRNEKQVRNELVERMLKANNKLTKEHAELIVKRMTFVDVINHALMR